MDTVTTDTNKPTMHTILRLRIERSAYKRGVNKGAAPMGPRWKSHYLAIDRGTHIAVRFHNTDIVRAYPDGTVIIDCNGYSGHMTTKTHLNDALRLMPNASVRMYSTKINSLSQCLLYVGNKRYRYYDGITLNREGAVTTGLLPFQARRINKAEVAELNADMIESGFKDAFRVLWSQATEEDAAAFRKSMAPHNFRNNRTSLVQSHNSNQWLGAIAEFSFERTWVQDKTTGAMRHTTIKHDHQQVWSRMMKWIKADMYEIIDTQEVVM